MTRCPSTKATPAPAIPEFEYGTVLGWGLSRPRRRPASTTPSIPSAPSTPDTLTVRTLRPDDGPLLDAVLSGLSPRSRYLRFHGPTPRLTAATRRALLDVDGTRQAAVVALDRPGQAEVAFEVVDARQRRGIGRRLLTRVADDAAAAGITRLRAMVLSENDAALGLMRAVFPTCLERRVGAVVEMTALLGDDVEITMDDIIDSLTSR